MVQLLGKSPLGIEQLTLNGELRPYFLYFSASYLRFR